jgi:hypothetical protein
VPTFWKLSAIALVVLGVTAVTSTLTTAYLTRVPVSAPPALAVQVAPMAAAVRPAAAVATVRPRPLPERALSVPRPAAAPVVLSAAAPAATPAEDTAVHESVPVSPDPVVASAPASAARPAAESSEAEPAASTAAAPSPAPARAPEPVATECDASGRTWKIAKPGLIGSAIGATLGAAGGAIAKGGKGAGQGAIVGGLAGAALGSGYGAYRTKNECGNVFGDAQKVSAPKSAPAADRGTPIIADQRPPAAGGAEAPFAAEGSERITIYSAR